MTRRMATLRGGALAAAFALAGAVHTQSRADDAADRARCEALVDMPNLTIVAARVVEATARHRATATRRARFRRESLTTFSSRCPANWNGRFLKWGDGGKDGDLDFADERVSEGYAVANSNMGHDNGSEPDASFAHDNRQAEIDFGYRAVHVTANAAKTLIRAYYGKPQSYSYFEGCSTGGREGLMEAQRYPGDFDGIVAGAPVLHYQELNAGHTWLLQRTFRNGFAGNLAYDTNGDGSFDSLKKLDMLAAAVMTQCDALDGIADGVIDDPLRCEFDPDTALAKMTCSAAHHGELCFTPAQLQTVKDFYRGPYDSRGRSVIKGRAPGAELDWEQYIPHAGNQNFPSMLRGAANGHTEFLLYENDPGLPVAVLNDLSRASPIARVTPPEHAWWEFDIDDVTSGKADFMRGDHQRRRPESRALPDRAQRQADPLARLGRRRRAARADARLLQRRRAGHLRRRPREGRRARAALHVPRHGSLRRRGRTRHVGRARAAGRLGGARYRARPRRRDARDRRHGRQRAPRLRLSAARRLRGPRGRRERARELARAELHVRGRPPPRRAERESTRARRWQLVATHRDA